MMVIQEISIDNEMWKGDELYCLLKMFCNVVKKSVLFQLIFH